MLVLELYKSDSYEMLPTFHSGLARSTAQLTVGTFTARCTI